MLQYITKRIFQFIPVFFGVTLALFLISTYMPGADPIQMRFGERTPPPEIEKQLIEQYGLDQPWYVQYVKYLQALIPVENTEADGWVWTGPDLGTSIYTGREVTDILAETYPYTIKLAFAAIIIEIFFGIGAGIISATRRQSFADVFVTLTTSILVSLPVFWLGLMLQYIFGIWLKDLTNGAFYLPISGASGVFPESAYLILPAITLASVSTAYAARIMRSQLLEVGGQDYVRTAYAKGLTERRVLWGHTMKNALIPVVTFIGLDLGAMLAGAVLTETVFNWPGVGFTIARAIFQRDFPVVFGGVTIMLFAVMIINLIVDVSYAFLDPRIRYGGTGE